MVKSILMKNPNSDIFFKNLNSNGVDIQFPRIEAHKREIILAPAILFNNLLKSSFLRLVLFEKSDSKRQPADPLRLFCKQLSIQLHDSS